MIISKHMAAILGGRLKKRKAPVGKHRSLNADRETSQST